MFLAGIEWIWKEFSWEDSGQWTPLACPCNYQLGSAHKALKLVRLILYGFTVSAVIETIIKHDLPRLPFFFLIEDEATGFFLDFSGVLLVNVRVGLPPPDICNIYTDLLENISISIRLGCPDNRHQSGWPDNR